MTPADFPPLRYTVTAEVQAVRVGPSDWADGEASLLVREVPPWVERALTSGVIFSMFLGEDYWYACVRHESGTLQHAAPGDWIVLGSTGAIFVVADADFARTYRPVADGAGVTENVNESADVLKLRALLDTKQRIITQLSSQLKGTQGEIDAVEERAQRAQEEAAIVIKGWIALNQLARAYDSEAHLGVDGCTGCNRYLTSILRGKPNLALRCRPAWELASLVERARHIAFPKGTP